jgi:hypothetical protein
VKPTRIPTLAALFLALLLNSYAPAWAGLSPQELPHLRLARAQKVAESTIAAAEQNILAFERLIELWRNSGRPDSVESEIQNYYMRVNTFSVHPLNGVFFAEQLGRVLFEQNLTPLQFSRLTYFIQDQFKAFETTSVNNRGQLERGTDKILEVILTALKKSFHEDRPWTASIRSHFITESFYTTVSDYIYDRLPYDLKFRAVEGLAEGIMTAKIYLPDDVYKLFSVLPVLYDRPGASLQLKVHLLTKMSELLVAETDPAQRWKMSLLFAPLEYSMATGERLNKILGQRPGLREEICQIGMDFLP